MANVTAQMIKELRERTGAGMSDCKSALVECDADMDKAIEFLRKKGIASAAKKAGRIAAEGAVFRVKANLTSATMRTGQEEGERQYWVDVRISNDGTMRIMQVLPAERGRVVPYE